MSKLVAALLAICLNVGFAGERITTLERFFPRGEFKDFTGERKLPILMFHHILRVGKDHPNQTYFQLSFAPEKLEDFLRFFQEHNIETLTFRDLEQILAGRKNFPERGVVLTFDDGYRNNWTAFELLEQFGMKGVFFIISREPGVNDWYLNWQQLKQMAAAGHEIGSHTHDHENLQELTPGQIKFQLEHSKTILEKQLGQKIISLCFPFGSFDSRVLEVARKNYSFARTTQESEILNFSKKWQLPTVRVGPEDDRSLLEKLFL